MKKIAVEGEAWTVAIAALYVFWNTRFGFNPGLLFSMGVSMEHAWGRALFRTETLS